MAPVRLVSAAWMRRCRAPVTQLYEALGIQAAVGMPRLRAASTMALVLGPKHLLRQLRSRWISAFTLKGRSQSPPGSVPAPWRGTRGPGLVLVFEDHAVDAFFRGLAGPAVAHVDASQALQFQADCPRMWPR